MSKINKVVKSFFYLQCYRNARADIQNFRIRDEEFQKAAVISRQQTLVRL